MVTACKLLMLIFMFCVFSYLSVTKSLVTGGDSSVPVSICHHCSGDGYLYIFIIFIKKEQGTVTKRL